MVRLMEQFFLKDRNIFILMFILAMICYSTVFQNGYSLDDQYIYIENTLANSGLEKFSDIFTKPSFSYNKTSFGYRPLTLLSFAIESQFFGINPLVSHGVNLMLYWVSCVLIYLLLKQVFPQESRWLALFTTIFFLVHPIHTEIVNNVKSRDEILMLLFGLLAARFWIKEDKPILFKSLAILFLICSILSKKSGLIFIGILPLITFFLSRGNWKRSLISFSIMTIPFLLWRFILKGYDKTMTERKFLSIENPLFGDEIPHEKTVIVLESIWFYTKALVFPVRFSAYYGFNSLEVNNFQALSLLGLLFLLFIAIVALYKLKESRPVSLGAILLLIGLAPYTNLFKPMVGIVAERFITISSLGWAMVVCYGVYRLCTDAKTQRWQKPLLILFALFLISSISIIRKRNSEWASEKSVLEAGLKEYPMSVVMNKTLGSIYNRELSQIKNKQERRQKVLRIIEVNENVVKEYPEKVTFTNIGNMKYRMLQDLPGALVAFQKAVELDPSFIHALSGEAHVYRDLGQHEKSVALFERVLKISPMQKGVYDVVIEMFIQKNDFESATRWNSKALRLFPGEAIFLTYQQRIPNRSVDRSLN